MHSVTIVAPQKTACAYSVATVATVPLPSGACAHSMLALGHSGACTDMESQARGRSIMHLKELFKEAVLCDAALSNT